MRSLTRIARVPLLAAVTAFTSGCCNFPPQPLTWSPPPKTVTGTVFHREVAPLPENAVVEVKLVEAASDGGAGNVVNAQKITWICNRYIDPPCNGPVFFELPYDPAQIDRTREYTVTARVLAGDQVLYESNTPNRVLSVGYIDAAQVLVDKPGTPQAFSLVEHQQQ